MVIFAVHSNESALLALEASDFLAFCALFFLCLRRLFTVHFIVFVIVGVCFVVIIYLNLDRSILIAAQPMSFLFSFGFVVSSWSLIQGKEVLFSFVPFHQRHTQKAAEKNLCLPNKCRSKWRLKMCNKSRLNANTAKGIQSLLCMCSRRTSSPLPSLFTFFVCKLWPEYRNSNRHSAYSIKEEK